MEFRVYAANDYNHDHFSVPEGKIVNVKQVSDFIIKVQVADFVEYDSKSIVHCNTSKFDENHKNATLATVYIKKDGDTATIDHIDFSSDDSATDIAYIQSIADVLVLE